MSVELKKGPELKAFKAKTNIKTSDGYNETWDIASNVPGAKKPSTPLEAIVELVGAVTRYAAMYANSGGSAILRAIESATMAWKWKSKNGYESGPDPRKEPLEKLAEELDFHLVPKGRGAGRAYLEESIRRDAEENREGLDYKAAWERRWKDYCVNEDGTLNLDAIQRELSDYLTLMGFYSRVLEHITGGRVSYLTTWPSVVCSVADDRVNEIVADETEELRAELDEAKAIDLNDTEAIYDTLLLVGHDIPIGVIPEWTDEEKRQALAWADAVHLNASDNPVKVPKYPDFLAPYRMEPTDFFTNKDPK